MAPVEDTKKPNFSDGELVAMNNMASDNKILLLGINKRPICATYSRLLVDNLLRVRVIDFY